MEQSKKTLYYLFLVINIIAWSIIGLTRNVMGDDALEAISWGELVEFGTNKHPPLSGWLMGGFYHLFGQHDFAAYFLGALCVTVGFLFIYKLSKLLLDEEVAACASLVMVPCYYYTYTLFYENFNCNILSMALWPMIAYYFYKSLKTEKTTDWVLFGITSALGALTKYQVIFLFLALFIYLLIYRRDCFKHKGVYISVLCGSVVILPHIIWLIQHDFFSFAYMFDRTEVSLHNTPAFMIKFGRIFFPVKFIIDQVLSVLPCILLFGFAALQAKNISVFKENKSGIAFVWILCFLPIIFQSLMGAVSNTRVMGMWGSMMVSFFGLLLFYQFPVKFNKDTFMFVYKWVCSLTLIWLISMLLFSLLQTKLHMGFPYQQIIPEMNSKWDAATNNAPLKYIGGDGRYVYKIKEYNPRPTTVILETFGYENPWVKPADIDKYGAIIIGESKKEAIGQVEYSGIILPKDYKLNVIKCKFEIKNKIGKTKKFKFWYVIIPPKHV